MPFINSKVSVKATEEQNKKLKERLGQAIAIVPGKSEEWLMIDLQDEQKMYFKGEDSDPIAYLEISVFGEPNHEAFEKMTAELCGIYDEILGIKPDHLYVKYMGSTDWGWNNRNF